MHVLSLFKNDDSSPVYLNIKHYYFQNALFQKKQLLTHCSFCVSSCFHPVSIYVMLLLLFYWCCLTILDIRKISNICKIACTNNMNVLHVFCLIHQYISSFSYFNLVLPVLSLWWSSCYFLSIYLVMGWSGFCDILNVVWYIIFLSNSFYVFVYSKRNCEEY